MESSKIRSDILVELVDAVASLQSQILVLVALGLGL